MGRLATACAPKYAAPRSVAIASGEQVCVTSSSAALQSAPVIYVVAKPPTDRGPCCGKQLQLGLCHLGTVPWKPGSGSSPRARCPCPCPISARLRARCLTDSGHGGHDDRRQADEAGHLAARRWRPVLGGAEPRRPIRRVVLRGCHLDGDLLPAELPVTSGPADAGALLPDRRGSAAGGFSRVQAMCAGRDPRFT